MTLPSDGNFERKCFGDALMTTYQFFITGFDILNQKANGRGN
jgi:hypothetical protein